MAPLFYQSSNFCSSYPAKIESFHLTLSEDLRKKRESNTCFQFPFFFYKPGLWSTLDYGRLIGLMCQINRTLISCSLSKHLNLMFMFPQGDRILKSLCSTGLFQKKIDFHQNYSHQRFIRISKLCKRPELFQIGFLVCKFFFFYF